MSSTDNMKTKLEQIPNSVSGDGKSFVAQLKRFLKGFRDDTEEKIDEIGAGSVEQVFGLHLTEQHDYDSKGASINNIFVEFDNTNVTDYLNAQIWMKNSSENNYQMVGTTSNVTYTIPNVKTGVTYYVKVVACSTHAGTSDFDTAPVAEIEIRGSVLIPAAPTQFYLTWDDQGPLWEWEYIDNGYVDFFELRMDGYAGTWNDNRLDSTQNTYSRVEPPVQSGTAYLFIRNVYGEYSPPATHTFNIVAPRKPANPTLDVGADGVVITMEALPSGCYGYVLEITDSENHKETFETSNNQFTFFQFSGTVSARYAFKAVTGNGHGEWSNSVSASLSGNIVDGAITGAKIYAGQVNANKIQTANIAANAINADKIAAGSINSDHISTEKLNATCIKAGSITSDQIQVGGIIGDSIAANTITAGKLSVGNLSAITANVGNLTGGSITGTELIGSTIKNAKNNPSFIVDSNGTVTGAKIIGSTFQNAATNPTFVVNSNGTVTGATIIGSAIQNAATNPTFSVDANGNIRGATLLSGSIAASMIGAGTITSDKLYVGTTQSNLIQANNIATGAITANQIAAGAVTANKIDVANLAAISATLGTFQSAAQGQPRVVISDSLIEVWDANRVRVRIGLWT